MPVLVLDPDLEERIRAERGDTKTAHNDEVWDEVLVMAPIPSNDHQFMVTLFVGVFLTFIERDRGDRLFPGANVSDREANWKSNYRIPDVALYLAGNPAKNFGSFWVGGPDLAVEIVSPGENPHDKLEFYASVKTREVLIVDRDPLMLEMYQLQGGRMVLAGQSAAPAYKAIASSVLPVAFHVDAGSSQPVVVVTHSATGETWRI
jgi:Uma2 family endonuclease